MATITHRDLEQGELYKPKIHTTSYRIADTAARKLRADSSAGYIIKLGV